MEIGEVGEALIFGLALAALKNGGEFTVNREGRVIKGTILKAWRLLEPYMPPGVELPAATRIEELCAGARAEHANWLQSSTPD
jgi:hypothetical protein